MAIKVGGRVRFALVWVVVVGVAAAAFAGAASSPFLAWRDPFYILAGFAGVAAMVLLVFQPLLATGYLPGLGVRLSRSLHRLFGALLVVAVIVHVGGLWIASPPDVIDVLLFRSPTPFSLWGVIAMWAVFVSALIAACRRKLRISPRSFRRLHVVLALVVALGATAHALLIVGTMEPFSRALLCALAVAAVLKVAFDLRVWRRALKPPR